MNYELARKLKAAGFEGHMQEIWDDDDQSGMLPWPTLSELIRACNEDKDSFFRLGLTTEGWRARDVRIEGEVVNGYPSPEEAVANLWLRINEK